MAQIQTKPNEVNMKNDKSQKAEAQKAKAKKAETRKAKAEAKKAEAKKQNEIAGALYEMAQELDWDERGIRPGDPEVVMVLGTICLEHRVFQLEQKFDDFVDRLRIFIRKDEEENGK